MKGLPVMKKFAAFIIVLLTFGNTFCYASTPYDSYTYSTRTGDIVAQYCPAPYYPAFTIDASSIGLGNWSPGAMCFDKEGNLYITDKTANAVIILDKNYHLKAKVDTFENSDGSFDFLGAPDGIFVTDDMDIYVCDTNQNRILILDQNYRIKHIYKDIIPAGSGSDYLFLPSKLIVDSAKNMYVLVKNELQGIMQLDKNGKFISFVGSNKVSYDPITKLWKKIMSKKQRLQMEQFIPVEYTNLSFDREGLIYTVSKAGKTTPIKRLNLSGRDVLLRNGYTDVAGDFYKTVDTKSLNESSNFVDITSDANGLVYALDATKGRIFVYNNEGFLFYAFGATGEQVGTLKVPTDIEVSGTNILVADEGNNRITVYKRTEYAQLISAADEKYNTGDYDESLALWNKVVQNNSNFELAYAQMGKIYLRRNEYDKALKYFELGNFRGDKTTKTTGYNKAFSELRRNIASNWLGTIVITILALLAVTWYVKRQWRKKHERKN